MVAEELHFGRAAQRLLIAQPALSQRVRRLEKELGVLLLERSPRRVAPTPAGRLVLAEARLLLAARDRLLTVAAGATWGGEAALRAAVPAGGPTGFVAALLAALDHRLPGVRLHLTEAETAQAVRGLFDGGLDVAVLAGEVTHPRLLVHAVLARPLGVLFATGHDLAGHAEVHLGDLASETLILMPAESVDPLHRAVLASCRQHGAALREVVPTRQTEVALALAAAGTGIALTDQPPPGPTGAPGTVWRPLIGTPLWRTLSLVATRPTTEAAIDVCQAAADVLRDTLGYLPPPTADPGPVTTGLPRPSSGFLT